MKILLVGINYAPELTGIGKYTGEMAEWLFARGHDVRVVTSMPYYPSWNVADGYRAWRYRIEWIKGVRVFRCTLWVPSRVGELTRILHLACFSLSSIPALVKCSLWKPQVFMAVAPAILSTPAVLLAAKMTGAVAWLHVHDFEIDLAVELGMMKFHKIKQTASWLESSLLMGFDRVSTISHPMVEKLKQKGVNSETIHLLPNWVDTEKIFPVPDSTAIRKKFGIGKDRFVSLYSGNMGKKQGLDIIVKSAIELQNRPEFQFVLCGDGADRERIWHMAKGLSNMLFLPLQPPERFNDLLGMADIHLLPQRESAADLVMPSKLAGIMASGKPVVATARADSEMAEVIGTAGLIVPPGDTDAFVRALLDMYENPEQRQNMGRDGRKRAIDRFDKNARLLAFETALTGFCPCGSDHA